MASFTGVGDNVELSIPHKGETVDLALSGTYDMQIDLQREVGAPGSGAWQFVKTVSTTANATVADTYTSESENEKIRLIVIVDTSGTCTATATDNFSKEFSAVDLKDPLGNPLLGFDEGGLIRYKGERWGDTSRIVNISAATTLNAEDHAGRIVRTTNTTGVAITLPEATGTGNVYTIFTGATISSGSQTIVAPSASTSFVGGAAMSTDIAGVSIIANSGDDTITMNGSTTGGVIGTWFRFTDVVTGVFMLEGFIASTGVEADPFSAAV